jgi:heme A synthase
MNTRPVSIAHLVFGLIFLGAAALWVVGAATDADAPDLALMAPAVLIGAGIIGLVAIMINARNSRTIHHTTNTDELDDSDTLVVNHEEQS